MIRELSQERLDELEFLIRNKIPIRLIDTPSYHFLIEEFNISSEESTNCIDDFYTLTDLVQARVIHISERQQHELKLKIQSKEEGIKQFIDSKYGQYSDIDSIIDAFDEATRMSTIDIMKTIKIASGVSDETVTIMAGETLSVIIDEETAKDVLELYER